MYMDQQMATNIAEDIEPRITYNNELEPLPVNPMEEYKGREVRIEPLNFGYILKVGCKSFALSTLEQVLKLITEYYANPTEMEKKYWAGEIQLV